MNNNMQRLMAEIEGRKAQLRNDSDPDELEMRKCMGKTILLMKNLRETFVESGKYSKLVKGDASKSLQKCRQHMGFLFTRVPCNEGGGKVNQEVQRGFHQHMDAVLMELAQFIKKPPLRQNPDHRDKVGTAGLNILNGQAEMEAAVRRLDTERNRARKLRSELSKSQLTIQLVPDAPHSDGGDSIEQNSPKWSDLITKKNHQSPQLSASSRNLTEKRTLLDLRESKAASPGPIWGNASQSSLITESWPDVQDSSSVTQTMSTSSKATIPISVSVPTLSGKIKNTHQSLCYIPDCKADCGHLSESFQKANKVQKDTPPVTGPSQNKEYQDLMAQMYMPVDNRSCTSLDPLFLRTPVSVASQNCATRISPLPVTPKRRRAQSITSHYSLGKTFGDKRAKLLKWCKERTMPYGLPMYEFSESWTSGRALAALMHSYSKSLIEGRYLFKESRRDTLTYAAAVAKSLGVGCEVDIVQECLQTKPDYYRVFQFVRELQRCLDHHKKMNKF